MSLFSPTSRGGEPGPAAGGMLGPGRAPGEAPRWPRARSPPAAPRQGRGITGGGVGRSGGGEGEGK